MDIRLASLDDRNRIMEIIAQAQEYLKNEGIPQWQNGYPNIETVINDINSNHNYVLVDNNNVIGTCMISFDEDPYYKVIEGNWLSNKPYVVIHRIAIDTTVKGKGLASHFFKFCECHASKKGVNYIRIDTHELNTSMQRCIEKNGFQKCGVVYVMDHAPRIAYEKEISNEI